MAKYHINKHGVPAPCRAKEGNCPLGGDTGGENHFDSLDDAQAYADKVNEETHSLLPGVEEERSPSNVENYDEDLEKRLMSNKVSDRMFAARRGYGAEILAHDDNERVKILLAEKGYEVETLAHDKEPRVRLATLINNRSTLSDSAIESLSKDNEKLIRRHVAKSGKHLDSLADDENAEVRGEVALHGSNLDKLANDESAWVREKVARNGVHLEKFSKDEDPSVRKEVATQGKYLDELSNDKHPEVRKMVALKGHNLTKLQNDESKDVREAVEYSMNPELYNKPTRDKSYSLYRKYSDDVKGVPPVDYKEFARENNVSVPEAAKMIMRNNIEIVNGDSSNYRVEFENDKPTIYSSNEKVKLGTDGYVDKSVKKARIDRINRLIIQYNEALKNN